MKVPSKKSIDYYILPNKLFCSVYGMWPDLESGKVFACLHLVLSVTMNCILIVPMIILVVTNWRDLEILSGAGCFVVSMAQLIFKTLYLIARREKTYTVYKELRRLWDTTDDPVERQSYEVYAHLARTCTIFFFVSAVITSATCVMSAAVDYIKDDYTGNGTDSIRHLPYDLWYGLGYINSPVFEILFVVQIVSSIVCIAGLCGMDGTCMTVILHLSGQFRLISTWFNNIGNNMECSQIDYLHDCPRHLAMDLTKCIRHHQRLLNTMKDVNNLLTPIIFIHLVVSVLQICLVGFAIISNNEGGRLPQLLCFLSSAMMQLLVWCWPGEILIQESQEIGYSVYLNVPWYKLPPIYRRHLLLTILRSQKYCSISAITFQALSIRTLSVVLNTAFSYFALLRRIQENANSG